MKEHDKSKLTGSVRRYGYDTVKQFYKAIKIALDALYKYQVDVFPDGKKTSLKETFEERLRKDEEGRDKSPLTYCLCNELTARHSSHFSLLTVHCFHTFLGKHLKIEHQIEFLFHFLVH